MPIYNFKCDFCGASYEELVPQNTQVIKCICGHNAKKIPSLSNFHLKGSGWYKDGYSKDKK